MTTSIPTRSQVAAAIEATLLDPRATAFQVRELCAAALAYGVRGVCVSPVYVAVAAAEVAGSGLEVVTVAGFPLGTSATAAKVAEVEAAAAAGADEVDVVLAYGWLLGGEEDAVAADLEAVVSAAHRARLAAKVILETGHLTPALIDRACALCLDAGAEWVKTSTGFGPRGASVDDVRRMREAVGDRARVKAAGGIRGFHDAAALLAAGADALGCSAFVALLEEAR